MSEIAITYATARDMLAYEATDTIPPFRSIKVKTAAAARAWLDLAPTQLGPLAMISIEFPDGMVTA